MLLSFRDHRRADRRPPPNVPGGIVVGLGCVAARPTFELVLTLTIELFAMSAFGTCSAGISRIDSSQRHTGQGSLVSQEQPELRECPTAVSRSLRSLKPFFCPGSDSSQFLDCNPTASALSFCDDLLADNMIHVGPKQTFPPAMTGDGPVNRLDSFLLSLPRPDGFSKPTTMRGPARTSLVNLRVAVVHPIRVGSEMCDAKVDADKAVNGLLFNVGKIDAHEQIESAIAVNKVRFTTIKLEKFPLLLATDKRDRLTSIDGPNAHGRGIDFPRKNPGIVTDGSVGPECSLAFPVEFIGVGNFGDTAYDNLRRQSRKFLPAGVIGQFVNGELPEHAGVPCTSG